MTDSTVDPATPPRRPLGRPSRLSRAQIVKAAGEMMGSEGLAAFSMIKLAKRMSASVMALYTYFPSREALLDAVADDVLTLLDLPQDSGEHWEAVVDAWCKATYAHFAEHPIGLELLYLNPHMSKGWIRIWMPIMTALSREGVRGKRLALAITWLGNTMMGIIYAQCGTRREGNTQTLAAVSDEHNELLAELNDHFAQAQGQAFLEYGTPHLINALRQLVDEARAEGLGKGPKLAVKNAG